MKPLSRSSSAFLALGALAAMAAPAGAQSFRALLTPEQVVPTGGDDPSGVSTSTGLLTAKLSADHSRLDYRIELFGPSLSVDVQGIHFHLAPAGTNGPHGLNVYGVPSFDDDDLVVVGASDVLQGSWDDSDENFAVFGDPDVRDPGDSIKLSDALAHLLAANVYVAVHTTSYPLPSTAELRGQLLRVPGTPSLGPVGLGLLALVLVSGSMHFARPGGGPEPREERPPAREEW